MTREHLLVSLGELEGLNTEAEIFPYTDRLEVLFDSKTWSGIAAERTVFVAIVAVLQKMDDLALLLLARVISFSPKSLAQVMVALAIVRISLQADRRSDRLENAVLGIASVVESQSARCNPTVYETLHAFARPELEDLRVVPRRSSSNDPLPDR